MKIACPLVSCLLAFALVASAQVAYVYDGGTPGVMRGSYLPSQSYPSGGFSLDSPLAVPTSSQLQQAALPPAGGMAIDQVTNRVYVCDGAFLTSDSHSLYPSGGTTTPLTFVAGQLLGTGVVSGLAFDGAAGRLFMCDDLSFGTFLPDAPFTPAGAFVDLTGLVTPPLTGLGWDPATDSLWLCNEQGDIYNFTTGGTPIGAQPVSTLALPLTSKLKGLAVNTTNGPGSFPPVSCANVTPGYNVIVTDGFFFRDAFSSIAPTIPITGGIGTNVYGAAFSADPQRLPGATACPGLGLPNAFTTGTVSPGSLTDIVCSNVPAGATVVLLFDICAIVNGLGLPGGDRLYISPFTPTSGSVGALADASGVADVTLTFPGSTPAGIQFSCQWYYVELAVAPFGICLSDGLTITISRP